MCIIYLISGTSSAEYLVLRLAANVQIGHSKFKVLVFESPMITVLFLK